MFECKYYLKGVADAKSDQRERVGISAEVSHSVGHQSRWFPQQQLVGNYQGELIEAFFNIINYKSVVWKLIF